jgi:hypothetical protein
MKKLHQTISARRSVPVGYSIYQWKPEQLAYCVCLWWAYPFFRIPALLIELKYALYWYLNKIGIMYTEEGQMMSIRDISFRRFYENIRMR